MHMMSRRKKKAQDAMTGNERIKHVTRLAHTTLVQCPCTAKVALQGLGRGRREARKFTSE